METGSNRKSSKISSSSGRHGNDGDHHGGARPKTRPKPPSAGKAIADGRKPGDKAGEQEMRNESFGRETRRDKAGDKAPRGTTRGRGRPPRMPRSQSVQSVRIEGPSPHFSAMFTQDSRSRGRGRGRSRGQARSISHADLYQPHQMGRGTAPPNGPRNHGGRGQSHVRPAAENIPGKLNEDSIDRRGKGNTYSHDELKQLLTTDVDSIVREVTGRKFRKLLNDKRIHSDELHSALEVIKATQVEDVPAPDSLRVLVTVVDSKLLECGGGLETCLRYVEKHVHRQNGGFLAKLVSSILFLLQQLFIRLPNMSLQTVNRILLDLHILGTVMLQQPLMADEANIMLAKVEKVESDHAEIISQICQGEEVYDEASWLPPDDYRRISIMPTDEDLEDDEPFLQENLMNGYTSTLQYLDTQFRLMREDLIAPLREGIKEHLMNVKDKKLVSRLQDGHIYRNVQFLGVDTKNVDTLAQVIKFDVAHLHRIQWENTKRLMYGSLVCLSADNFKTPYFATIADRDPKGLRKGLLSVKIEGITTVPLVQRAKAFIMIEATSYLEAYRYVLARLQNIGMEIDLGKEMQFQRYIVNCEPDIQPPSYLQNNSFLLLPGKDNIKRHTVLPLSEVSWSMRKPEDFGLDQSQFNALKHTLSSEMALIQGPPGTGKTFIGLKIMDILLQNKEKWKGLTNRGHVMVICFTNHALDQFLEGVLELQGKKPSLVRIGGRSKTESLAEFNLRELRRGKYKRCMSQEYWDSFKAVKSDLEKIAKKIQVTTKLVSKQPVEIPSLKLQQHMTPSQLGSFQAYYQLPGSPKVSFDVMMRRWLVGWDGINESTWDWCVVHLLQSEIMKDTGNMSAMVNSDSACQEGASGTGVKAPPVDAPTKDSRGDTEEAEDGDSDSDSDGSLISVAGEAELIESERVVDDGYQRKSDLYKEYIARTGEWTKQGKGRKGTQNKQGNADSKNAQTPIPMSPKERINLYLETSLENANPMSQEIAMEKSNMWILTSLERFQLYLHWCDALFQDCDVALAYDLLEQEERAQELKSIQLDRDCQIISDQDVVGLTTTGAAKYADIVQRIKPQVVVVEEAAEVLEAHIVTALTRNCHHLILIGDHKQLRPNPTVYELARDYKLNISLFERMIRNNIEVKTLRLQHRMRPDISKLLVPWIYDELVDNDNVLDYPSIHGIEGNVVFLDHDQPENGASESRSHSNDFEADFVVGLCKYFLQQTYDPSQITILTTYTGQMFNIRKRMPKSQFEGVRVTPVDNYQGEENDIIILSFVRSNSRQNIGFLKEPNRVCVAMSRAKMGFYAFGNFTMYANKTKTWKGMVGDMRKHGFLKKSFTLACQNHPEVKTEVASAKDFRKIPDGGCHIPCQAPLECGHICSLRCHVKDKEHKEYKCKIPVVKICERGLHERRQKCWKELICQEACPEMLECGHHCQNICGEDCTTSCMEQCEKYLSCGHRCWGRCSEECPSCPVPCERLMACGHKCHGLCGQDCSKLRCKALCRKTLECGHICSRKCPEPCNPCQQPCERTLPCGHRCKEICGKECTKLCKEPCQKLLPCEHKCPRGCSELCEIKCQVSVMKTGPCGHNVYARCSMNDATQLAELCGKNCGKVLDCGHACTSSCGRCSSGCRKVCNAIVMKTASCGHKVTCRCNEDPDTITCHFDVDKALPCKHQVRVKCHQDVSAMECQQIEFVNPGCGHHQAIQCCNKKDFKCRRKVTCKLACDHKHKIECYKADKFACPSPCQQELPCGHLCKGKCGECRRNEKHTACKEMVSRKLVCGHRIKFECHQADAPTSVCRSQCQQKLPCGHRCTGKCSACSTKKDHAVCNVKVKCTLACGHECEIKCYQKADIGRHVCRSPCQQKLPCRHRCTGKCSECSTKKDHAVCNVKVKCTLTCGHEGEIKCYQKADIGRHVCRSPCQQELPCGHRCGGECGDCRRKEKHKECKEKCSKKQLCGHNVGLCPKTCGHTGSCAPCKVRCEAKCWHRPCRKACGENCTPCAQPCKWGCPHSKCTKRCNEICDKIPCDEPCPKKVPSCGHPCPGLCGEPCPFTCIRCHPTKFRSSDQTIRYIRVQPCDHTVPKDQMDAAMKKKPPVCPTPGCGRLVLFCPRYDSVIKEYMGLKHAGEDGVESSAHTRWRFPRKGPKESKAMR